MIERMKIIFLFLSFFISSFVYAQQPSWLEAEMRSLNFPSDQFLFGYSLSNKSLTETKDELFRRITNSAKKELIESISVSISSQSTLKTENAKGSFDQIFSMEVSSISEAELIGLLTETYFDIKTNTGYAFVYIRKHDFANYLTTQYESKLSQLLSGTSDKTVQSTLDLKIFVNSIFSNLRLIDEIKGIQKILIS